MKYFVTIIILTKLLSFNVSAEWKTIFSTWNYTSYHLDYKTIVKENNLIYVWLITNFEEPKGDIYSIKTFHEINCNNSSNNKILKFMPYTDTMAKSGFIENYKSDDKGWNFIADDSIKSVITNTVCNLTTKFKIGDKVYLNANTGNPNLYFNKALNLKNKIIEVGNEITGLKKSPFGRKFTTRATSKITLDNGKIITAKLDNFRNLVITDDVGKVLYKNKVSGATSIYAFKHEDKTIAWGVGWHKYGVAKTYFSHTDFTVLSTYIPVLKEDKVEIHYHYLRPNITEYYDALKNSNSSVFANAFTILGSSGVSNCHYCGLDFFVIDNIKGLVPLVTIDSFESNKINLNSIDPLIAARALTMSYCDQINYYRPKVITSDGEKKDIAKKECYYRIDKNKFKFYKDFISKNYKDIISSAVDNWYYSSSGFTVDNCSDKGSYNYNPYGESFLDFEKRPISEQKKVLINHFEKSCNLETLYSYEMVAKKCFQSFEVFMFDQYGENTVNMDICSN